jgi:hypothetical protein
VEFDVAVLALSSDGTVSVGDRGDLNDLNDLGDRGDLGASRDTGHGVVSADGVVEHIGVNREFLLDALAVANRDQLVLELGGPIAPLAIRLPEDGASFSLLMPVRLHQDA